ncbi:MAG: EF-hand domain-containing protein [Phycisphaerales bacterium]|nr:EF-hand domain-containing protein [Phycisphaerales bacterium]
MNPVSLMVCAGLALSAAGTASGQVRSWANPVSGLWRTASNWTGGDRPDTTAENAVLGWGDLFAVTIDGEQFFIGSLSLNNPNVRLVIQSSAARSSTDLACIRDISSIGLIRIAGNPSTTNNAVLQINASGRSISGTGELRLEEFGDSHLIINVAAGGTFTNAGHRITGAGTLRGSGGTLVNSGTILADRAGGMLITCPLRNTATVRAVSPGALTIGGTVWQEGSAALLEADAATLTFDDASDINGGIVRGVNGGVVTLSAGTVTMSNVTSEGDWVIPVYAGSLNTSLVVDTGWTNNALVRLPASATTNHNRLYIATNALLGAGEVRLEKAGGADFILKVGDGWVINGPGHSITGAGWIGTAFGPGTLINQGTIRADRDGGLTVQLPLLENQSAVRIVAPGSMSMNTSVTQTAGGFIEADGATLTFGDAPAGDPSVSGGTVRAVNGGVVRVPGALVISGVTGDGDWTVEPASPGGGGSTPNLHITESWTNNGLIDLPAGWQEPRLVTILTDGLTIEGDGEIRLGEPGWTRLQLPEGGTATNGPGHRISGVGTIVAVVGGSGATLRNAGTLAPGALLGALTMNANLLQLSTGVIEIELQGDGAEQRDLLNVNGYAVALAGTLRVLLRDGYIPPACEEITVVRGNISGAFDVHDLPVMPQGLMHVMYLATEVKVGYVPGDMNGDGLLDFADYLEFLNLFDGQDPRADLNGDGLVDFSDYLEFLNLYDAGC